MSVQYQTGVDWDVTLKDLEYTDTTSMPESLQGLVMRAVKVTTGAPTGTAGKFIPGALVVNAVDGDIYQNAGTTASPSFTVIGDSNGGPSAPTGPFIAASSVVTTAGGNATEQLTVTGALASDQLMFSLVDRGTNSVSITSASITGEDEVTIVFSADPGNDAVVSILAIRVAS